MGGFVTVFVATGGDGINRGVKNTPGGARITERATEVNVIRSNKALKLNLIRPRFFRSKSVCSFC
jgi:hypothetical protein